MTDLAAPSTSALTPALFRRLHPKPYLDKFVGSQVRPDGRPLGGTGSERWREASINTGKFTTIEVGGAFDARAKLILARLDCRFRINLNRTFINPRQARQNHSRLRFDPRGRSPSTYGTQFGLHRSVQL